jgi:hypothetical protein
MSLKAKDLLIIVMALFIVALMVLMYKVNKLVVERIPERVPMEVYVVGMTEAVDRHNQFCVDLSHTTGWLKRHLDTCLTLLETERGLEPIPKARLGFTPYGQDQTGQQDSAMPSCKVQEPFWVPYEKPKRYVEKSSEENNLRLLQCKMNLAAMAVTMSRYSVEMDIDNFQQRLRRLDPNNHDPNNLPEQEKAQPPAPALDPNLFIKF